MNLYVFPALFYGGYGRHVSCVVVAENLEQAKTDLLVRMSMLAAIEGQSVVETDEATREWLELSDEGRGPEIKVYPLEGPMAVIVETYE